MVVLGRRSARSPLRDSSKSGSIPVTGGGRIASPTHSMQVRSLGSYVEPKSPRSRNSSSKSASGKINSVVSPSVGSRSNTFCKDEKS